MYEPFDSPLRGSLRVNGFGCRRAKLGRIGRLVVEREEAIKAFVPEEYGSVEA